MLQLYMNTFVFLSKFSWCGLYSGALNSPAITVIAPQRNFNKNVLIPRMLLHKETVKILYDRVEITQLQQLTVRKVTQQTVQQSNLRE